MKRANLPQPASVQSCLAPAPPRGKRPLRLSAFALLLVAALAGCTVGPNYHEPAAAVPSAYDIGPTTRPSAAPATQTAGRPIDIARWWHSMGDPELDSLVERAVAGNLDIRIALARLQESRSDLYVVAGIAMPEIDAVGGAGWGTGTDDTKGRVPSIMTAGTNTKGLSQITHVVGFDAGWEIDLFGRYRRELEAAQADTQAAAELRNEVLITVVSDVARAYLDNRALQDRLDIARQNIDGVRQEYDLVRERFRRGLTTELDVVLAQRQLATIESEIGPLQAGIAQAQRRVAVLLGLPAQDLYAELARPGAMPEPPVNVAAGVPLDLLRRRPDIRRAERQLAAATARIGVATADLFPRLAVSAATGLQGEASNNSVLPSGLIWSMGPSVYLPILDFGRIDATIESADFKTQSLFYSYRGVILAAVQEVDDALGNYTAEHDRLDQLGIAVQASRRALVLATGRYDQGLTDFLNVLDAQRQLYVLEDQYAVARQTVAVQYIAICKALGGGWENYAAIPAIRRPRPALIAAGAYAASPPQSPPAHE